MFNWLTQDDILALVYGGGIILLIVSIVVVALTCSDNIKNVIIKRICDIFANACVILFVLLLFVNFISTFSINACLIDFISRAQDSWRTVDYKEGYSFLSKVDNFNEATEYYILHRYKNRYMDTLYGEFIFPTMEESDYYYIKDNIDKLEGTPYYPKAEKMMSEFRTELLEMIDYELNTTKQQHIDAYEKNYLPYIKMGMDSLIEASVNDAIEDYCGGILNINKLGLFLGKDANSIYEKIRSKTAPEIKEYVDNSNAAYCKLLNLEMRRYVVDILSTSSEFDTDNMNSSSSPAPDLRMSKYTLNYIKDYSEKEKSGMVASGLRDFVAPVAIGCVSGGLSYAYEGLLLLSDINAAIKEINEAKITPEEIISGLIVSDISKYAYKYIDDTKSDVHDFIKSRNSYTKQFIHKEL